MTDEPCTCRAFDPDDGWHTPADHRSDCPGGPGACGGCWGCLAATAYYYERRSQEDTDG